MDGNQLKGAPLAWSQSGDPIELPASASLWRVRRLTGNGKGGAPELVYGADGLPLVVDIGISSADFGEAVERRPGKYRLEALDELRRAVQGVPAAYVVVSGAGPAGRVEAPDGPPNEVAIKTLADVFMRQSAHVNVLLEACAKLVTAVDAAGVSRREPPPIVVAPEPVRRNGIEEDDQDDEDDDEVEAPTPPPAWLQHATHFCASVPADNLRALGAVAPDLLANGIRKVIRDGIVSGLLGGTDEASGGGS